MGDDRTVVAFVRALPRSAEAALPASPNPDIEHALHLTWHNPARQTITGPAADPG
ncbi:hypothetical protein [Alloactinosynnema sp. L-07]|nr:hypothetical protein [Alloactinosynnema sp. L-07]